MSGWYYEKGPESDVVISSRVRLARNLKDYPFPVRMTEEQRNAVIEQTRAAMMDSKKELERKFLFYDIGKISTVDKQSMVERHLISPDFIENAGLKGLVISEDESISVMINEEDHLRVQSLFPGMQIDKAWELCSKVDTILEKKLNIAYDSKYGYLTCCPTNIGTGIRASAMLHLPALTMTGHVRGILEACAKLGIAVRGIYGEHSEALGDMFQISNQITLGQSEDEIVANISNISRQIIEQERILRNEMFKQNPYRFEDKVYRSFGILSNARIISSEEALKLISDVRLGINMGIISNIKIETINQIMILSQAAGLQKLVGRVLAPEERDIIRAETIRKMLNDI